MKNVRFKLLKPFAAFGLAMLLSLPVLHAQEAETEDEPKTVTVTGSRIKRIDVETPSPVVVITREDLDATGFSTVGDALRALPYNSGTSLTSVDAGTSFTPGVSSLNLRGLGNNNTLVLINGRRASPFGASGFNGFQSVFDFNSVPASAIESIEILKDGASAIYGSDAVSGVINIKLRKDFEGMNAQVSVGNTEDTDSLEKQIFWMMGTTTGDTSIVTTFDYRARNGIAAADIPYFDSPNLSSDPTTNTFFEPIPGTDRFDIDWRSSRSFPARFVLPVDAGGLPAGSTVTLPGLTTNPDPDSVIPITRSNPDQFGNSPGYYNFLGNQEGNASNLLPESENWGFYTSATHEITDTLTFDAEVSFRRANTRGNAAPAPLTASDENGDAPGGGLLFPATNPHNPFGEDIVEFAWRMHSSGPRIFDVRADYPRVVASLEGKVGFTWTWETGVMWTQSEYTNTNPGTVFDSLVQDALNGVVLDGDLLYANPFGPEDPRVTDYYTGENPQTGKWEVRSYSAEAAGEIFQLPAGPVGLALGTEFREEAFDDVRTLANETGDIVGGSEGFGVQGDREVLAAFAEVSLPVTSMIELQGAARFEDYSDFGTTTKPKIAAKFRPFDFLLLRASFGQSFKAPDLPFLFSAGSVSFTPQSFADPKRPGDPPTQLKTIGQGNPDLGPEETDTTYVGISFEPGEDILNGWLDGLILSVDWFEFDQENLITREGASTVLQNEDNPNFVGGDVIRSDPLPTDPPGLPGPIFAVTTDWFNAPTQVYEGVDMSIRYDWETANLGDFRAQVVGTYIRKFERNDLTPPEQAGEYLVPEWRANANFAWTRGDWAASVYASWVDGFNDAFGGFLPDVEDYLRVNPQVSFSGFLDTRITVGVRNVFDERPPLDYSNGGQVFSSGVHNFEPRFWYLRLNRDF
ncbi:MAG: TonB-dependent receptor plug domain-containing protein [Opitutales bacterium]